MNVIPVIDLLNGVVVQGVGGRRSEYRPVNSSIALSPDPSVVLGAFAAFGCLSECYIADLDALQGRCLNRCTLAELSRSPLELVVDRGVTCLDQAGELFELGADRVVVASESLPSLQMAADLVSRFGRDNLIFSLDLKRGQPLASNADWVDCEPLEILSQVTDVGYRRLIVLDLASVGMNAGPATTELCRDVATCFPDVEVVSGGGVRSLADLQSFKECGCGGVLVSSAIHKGAISPEDLQAL